MQIKVKKHIYKHTADIFLEKIKYTNETIISLAGLIESDYIMLLTNDLPSDAKELIGKYYF